MSLRTAEEKLKLLEPEPHRIPLVITGSHPFQPQTPTGRILPLGAPVTLCALCALLWQPAPGSSQFKGIQSKSNQIKPIQGRNFKMLGHRLKLVDAGRNRLTPQTPPTRPLRSALARDGWDGATECRIYAAAKYSSPAHFDPRSSLISNHLPQSFHSALLGL